MIVFFWHHVCLVLSVLVDKRTRTGNLRKRKGTGLMIKGWLPTVIVGLVLAGCQGAPQTHHGPGLDNNGFLSLWSTYERCENGGELYELMGYEHTLHRSVEQATRIADPLIALPDSLERFVKTPKPRLSVDPKAMAAACTLYTGQMALTVGRTDIATEMFEAAIDRNPEPEYGYYVAEAQEGLAQVRIVAAGGSPRIIPVTGPGRPALQAHLAK